MKGNVRIGGALSIGVMVILLAFYAQGTTNNTREVAAVRGASATGNTDSNGNGIKDWEESLQNKLFDTITTPDASSTETSEQYTPPTTFTGRFSEAFMQDYLQGKIDGKDFSNPTEFIKNAVTAIDENTGTVQHTRAELHIIPTTSESLHVYGNALASIIQKNSIQNEHELIIFKNALDANNPKILEKLSPVKEVYTKTISETLLMSVPDTVGEAHTSFLNASEGIKADIEAMQIAFDDPLFSLARIRGYETDATSLANSFTLLNKLFTENGVTFTSNEPGALFYLFDTI